MKDINNSPEKIFQQALALEVLQKIAQNIQGNLFIVMADKTADESNKEQVVVCIRWVDSNFTVHEDFVGLKPVARTTVDELAGGD